MGDEAVAKKKRSKALSKFTKNLNTFNGLLEVNSPKSLVEPQYELVKTCWSTLEDAQDEYLDAIEDIDAAGGLNYLDDPGVRHTEALKAYAAYLKAADVSELAAVKQRAHDADLLGHEQRQREADQRLKEEQARAKEELIQKFASLKVEVDVGVASFSHLTQGLKDSLGDASEEVKREQWLKVDTEFTSLKNKLLEVVSSNQGAEDLTDLKGKFKNDAEVTYLELQKWILPQLKAVVKTSGGGASSSTKREPISLPEFKGDPVDQPFLKFPVWLKQWEKLIGEYDEKFWSRLLCEKLDDAATEKIVGLEDKYGEAMEYLKAFYGDPCRVVECVMQEVKGPGVIADGDYQSLVAYSDTLARNFICLENISLEHEISYMPAIS